MLLCSVGVGVDSIFDILYIVVYISLLYHCLYIYIHTYLVCIILLSIIPPYARLRRQKWWRKSSLQHPWMSQHQRQRGSVSPPSWLRLPSQKEPPISDIQFYWRPWLLWPVDLTEDIRCNTIVQKVSKKPNQSHSMKTKRCWHMAFGLRHLIMISLAALMLIWLGSHWSHWLSIGRIVDWRLKTFSFCFQYTF